MRVALGFWGFEEKVCNAVRSLQFYGKRKTGVERAVVSSLLACGVRGAKDKKLVHIL